MIKKTKNVAKALLVLCDKAKNIRVGIIGLLTFFNSLLSFFLFSLPVYDPVNMVERRGK